MALTPFGGTNNPPGEHVPQYFEHHWKVK